MRAFAQKNLLIVVLGILVLGRIVFDFSGHAAAYWHEDYQVLFSEQSAFYARFYPHEAVNAMPTGREGIHSSYPPWSFVLFTPLVPSWLHRSAAHEWFDVVQALALLLVAVFVWRRGSEGGARLGLALTLGFLAMTGVHADIVFGNFLLILTVGAIGLLYAVRARRWWLASALWLIIMVKPQFAWAFAGLFLERNAWKPWLVAVAGLAGLALGVCLWTRVDPLHVFQVMLTHNWTSMARLSERPSLVSLLGNAGVPSLVSSAGCAIAGLGFLAWRLTGPLAQAAPLQRFALVGLISRFSSYHNICDDLLLLFALIWLGQRAWASSRVSDWIAFLALGLTVWAPTSALVFSPAKIAVVAAWILLAIWVSRQNPTAEERAS